MKKRAIWLLAIALSASVPTVASAAKLWVGSGGGSAIERDKVTIVKVENGQMTFRTTSGNETTVPIANVQRMMIDDEPLLNQAEEAFATGKFDVAADAYAKAIGKTNKVWVKDHAAVKLITAANKNNRLDAAITGYLSLVERDPAAAMRNKPTMPSDPKSSFLALGAQEINKQIETPNQSTEQKQALYTLLLEIQRTMGDQAGVEATLAKLTAGAPQDTGRHQGDDSNGALASVKISIAQIAIDRKEFPKARAAIKENLDLFTTPALQADALWYLAEADYGIIGEKYDNVALKDAALAYMRVVAFFQNQPGSPHVPESLFKVGEILERISEPKDAQRIYQEVATKYPNSSVAAKAQAAADKLKGPKPES